MPRNFLDPKSTSQYSHLFSRNQDFSELCSVHRLASSITSCHLAISADSPEADSSHAVIFHDSPEDEQAESAPAVAEHGYHQGKSWYELVSNMTVVLGVLLSG